jgi:hypothetical protein
VGDLREAAGPRSVLNSRHVSSNYLVGWIVVNLFLSLANSPLLPSARAMADHFPERLRSLSESQQSVQSLSMWIQHQKDEIPQLAQVVCERLVLLSSY